LLWQGYDAGWYLIVNGGDIIDESKHSISKNPTTNLYYRLLIKNVGLSDLKKYSCQGRNFNGVFQTFYLQLDFLGRCNYILVIFKVENRFVICYKKITFLMLVCEM
jgi:hypothetical protein